MNLDEVLIAVVVFYGIVSFIKVMSSHFLKRKIIKTGHFDRAEILDQNTEIEVKKQVQYDQYPALKWGLVAFFGGLGFIVMEFLGHSQPSFMTNQSVMPYGIFFVSISVGFLLYYYIITKKVKE